MSITIRVMNALKINHSIVIYLICLVLLSGCADPQKNNIGSSDVPVIPKSTAEALVLSPVPSLAVSPNFPDPVASQSAPPQETAIEPPTSPVPHRQAPAQYNLDAVLDYEQHSLSVAETIHYVNLSSDDLTSLTLVVEPNLTPGGFNLRSMTWEGGENIDAYELKDNQMQIPLLQPLLPGEELEINLNYHLVLPELSDTSGVDRPVAYGFSERQTNLVDWYPYLPPYLDGQGWLVHSPWGIGEYQVFDIANFTATVTLAEPVPDLVIAASAPAIQEGERYTYQLEAARTFALSASTEYLVQTTTMDGVTIISYSFPYDKYAGQEVLYNTANAVQLFSRLIAPYPHSSLSIVEADFLDGMEYDGLFFLSHGFYDLYDGTPKGYLTFIAAHETAHQWWFSLVGNDQAMEPWLDEALCTYMEHIYYENFYSDYQPSSGESLVDWWWYYRVNFYNPEGWVNGSIYDFIQARPYRNAVYLNGALFLDDLRNLVGDQAFFATLRDYANINAYKIATAQNFFYILRAHTTQDLAGLLSRYFQSNKYYQPSK